MNIFKLFKNQNRIIKSANTDCNQLIFSIHKNGEIELEIFILNDDEPDSTHLSNFLFSLNNGIYISSIISTLSKISKNDNSYISFINNTLTKWYNQITNNISNNTTADDPIVPPTEFGDKK